MTFTERDAENDGLIKSETGREMAKVAKSNNPELFEHFQNVCEEKGREPADVLGEGALRGIKSQDFSDRVLSSEVSMSQLNRDEIRTQDVKYVKQLTEELGLDDEESGSDPIDRLIEQRLESVSSSPVPELNNQGGGSAVSDEQLASTMQAINNKIDDLERKVESSSADMDGSQGPSEDKSIDDIFSDGDGDGGSSGEPDQDVQTDDGGEDGSEGEPEDDDGPVIEPDIASTGGEDASSEGGDEVEDEDSGDGEVIQEEIELSDLEEDEGDGGDTNIMESEGAEEE